VREDDTGDSEDDELLCVKRDKKSEEDCTSKVGEVQGSSLSRSLKNNVGGTVGLPFCKFLIMIKKHISHRPTTFPYCWSRI